MSYRSSRPHLSPSQRRARAELRICAILAPVMALGALVAWLAFSGMPAGVLPENVSLAYAVVFVIGGASTFLALLFAWLGAEAWERVA